MRLSEVMGRGPTGGTYETYLETPDGEEHDVIVHWVVDPDDPSVGYRGTGVKIEYVETSDAEEVPEHLWPEFWEENTIDAINRQESEAAEAGAEEKGEWEYERRRDREY